MVLVTKSVTWKTRICKQKKYFLPKHIQSLIKERKTLQKTYQSKVQNGEIDSELERKLKKHSNYCNKVIKQAVGEKVGQNITDKSCVKDINMSCPFESILFRFKFNEILEILC